MLVRRLLAATVMVPLLLVAGCSDEEPEPIMPTTSSPTTAPSSTPTVDPLAIPAEAKKATKAGAEALVRHFFAMNDYFLETGDADPVRKLYRPTCIYCEAPVQIFEFGQKKGHTYSGSEVILSLKAFLLGKDIADQSAVAFVSSRQTAIVERDGGGKVVSRIRPVRERKKEYYLIFENGMWVITNVEDAD